MPPTLRQKMQAPFACAPPARPNFALSAALRARAGSLDVDGPVLRRSSRENASTGSADALVLARLGCQLPR